MTIEKGVFSKKREEEENFIKRTNSSLLRQHLQNHLIILSYHITQLSAVECKSNICVGVLKYIITFILLVILFPIYYSR